MSEPTASPDGEHAARGPIVDPVPIRRHQDAFAAGLDEATLAEAGIPAQVIEPRGPAAGHAMAIGPASGVAAVLVVPAEREDEARAVLEEAEGRRRDTAAAAAAAAGAADGAHAPTGQRRADDAGSGPADPVDPAGPADLVDPADPADPAEAPFQPRGMPLPARIGLVLAVLLLVLGVAGGIATLFIGP